MLHIILLILKIIGIIILVILGLLLLMLSIALLVPVRYLVTAEHGQEFRLAGKVGWLLNLFGVKFSHLDGEFHIRIRALWFILYDNLDSRHQKIKRGRQKASVKNKSSQKKKSEVKAGRKVNTVRDENKQEEATRTNSEEWQNNQTIESNLEQTKESRAEQNDINNTEKKEKESIFKKVKNKIISIKDKVLAFFKGIKSKIIERFKTLVNLKQKINLISRFLKDSYNKEGFRITYASLKKLLKHVLPTKLRSRIVFGTGDPCSTGQALGVMSILYSFYGDKVQIIPDFENKILEGKHFAKGRIRLITVLIIVIRLLLDKRFKKLKSNFEILKEAL